jgi:hypothetical protein
MRIAKKAWGFDERRRITGRAQKPSRADRHLVPIDDAKFNQARQRVASMKHDCHGGRGRTSAMSPTVRASAGKAIYTGKMNYLPPPARAVWLTAGPLLVATLVGCGGLLAPGQASSDGGEDAAGRSTAAVGSVDPAGSDADAENLEDATAAVSATAMIRAELQLPAGVDVSSFKFTLTGGAGVVRAGAQTFPSDGMPTFSLAGVPAPARYSLDMTATGQYPLLVDCTASAILDVSANQETVVVLIAQCQ